MGIPYRLIQLFSFLLLLCIAISSKAVILTPGFAFAFVSQDLLLKACANLAFFIWTHELLPLDILLLALIDRDDDPHALRIVVCLFL